MRKYTLVNEDGVWAVKALTDGAAAPHEFESRLAAAGAMLDDRMSALGVPKESRPIAFGGAMKATTVGDTVTIEGYAILFTDKQSPDLYKDFFTKGTDFFQEPGETEFTIPWVLFHHGLDPTVKGARMATNAAARIDDVGVWVKFQMNKRDKYRKAVAEMAEKGELGFSTGSAPHLAAKKAMDNGTNEITSWPPIELSLTPTPIESRTLAIVTVKAYEEEMRTLEQMGVSAGKRGSFGAGMTRYIKDYCQDKGLKYENVVRAIGVSAVKSAEAVGEILSGAAQPTGTDIKAFARTLSLDEAVLRALAGDDRSLDTIKGVFQDQLNAEGWRAWELWAALSKVIHRVANAASATGMTGAKFDQDSLIDEAVDEYAIELKKAIKEQVEEWLEGDCDYSFYLRALVDPTAPDVMAMNGLAIEDHSSLAVSAFDSLLGRVRGDHAGRVKAGRPISDKNYKVLDGHLTAVEDRVKQARSHMDGMRGKPDAKAEAARARTKALLQEQELQLTEV